MSDNTNTTTDNRNDNRSVATTGHNRSRRWAPFSVLNELDTEMDRMFGRRLPFFQPLRRGTGQGWAPSTDVYEKDGNIVVKAELPGVDKDDIDVSVDHGDLVIRGSRSNEDEVNDDNYYRMERFSGSFYRRFPLPDGVDTDRIDASFNDGVLEVTVPKPAESESGSKKVSVH